MLRATKNAGIKTRSVEIISSEKIEANNLRLLLEKNGFCDAAVEYMVFSNNCLSTKITPCRYLSKSVL